MSKLPIQKVPENAMRHGEPRWIVTTSLDQQAFSKFNTENDSRFDGCNAAGNPTTSVDE